MTISASFEFWVRGGGRLLDSGGPPPEWVPEEGELRQTGFGGHGSEWSDDMG